VVELTQAFDVEDSLSKYGDNNAGKNIEITAANRNSVQSSEEYSKLEGVSRRVLARCEHVTRLHAGWARFND
jgi:hypothetical protein